MRYVAQMESIVSTPPTQERVVSRRIIRPRKYNWRKDLITTIQLLLGLVAICYMVYSFNTYGTVCR